MTEIEKHIEIIERMMFAFATSTVDKKPIFPALKYCKEVLQEKLQCEENKALTVEELHNMNIFGWCWVKVIENPTHCKIESGYYRKYSDYTHGEAFCCGYPGMGYSFDYSDYGKTWLAYRNEVISVAEESEG